jgi:hypothetical protein
MTLTLEQAFPKKWWVESDFHGRWKSEKAKDGYVKKVLIRDYQYLNI